MLRKCEVRWREQILAIDKSPIIVIGANVSLPYIETTNLWERGWFSTLIEHHRLNLSLYVLSSLNCCPVS